MNFFQWLLLKTHRCYFGKPIASRYISFNTRDIIFECRCGKRKLKREYRSFGTPFSMETTHLITNEEIQKLLIEGK